MIYVPCIFYSLLSRPTNAQHIFINNILCNVSNPTWIEPAQNRDRWRALVNAVMNLLVPKYAGNFLTSWKPFIFSWRTLLYGVCPLQACYTFYFIINNDHVNILIFWRRNYFFNFSTPVYKMWIIQEPNKLELWNKLHFKERKNGEYTPCLKYSVPIFVE